MGKRNRRRKTYHLKPASIGMGVMFAFIVVPWAFYCLLNLSNDQIATQMKLLEQDKRSQEESFRRHTAEWNQLIEPKRLDEAIARNGLKLNYAPPERSVIVSQSGKVHVAPALQRALAQARIERAGKAGTEGTAVASAGMQVSERRSGRRSRR